MNSVLIIDKPGGMTSHDVVSCVRRIAGQKAVGHLGTLDPMATGVLPLVLGNFTRLADFYKDSAKVYEATIRFGFSTDTYDAEGEPTSAPVDARPARSEIEEVAKGFRGEIEQVPPPFSAKKVAGVPAHRIARRKSEPVVLAAKRIEVSEFTIGAVDGPTAEFRIAVSSGTYIRSIAHEMGQKLGCGAHLSKLRRTRHGDFSLEAAHTLDELQRFADFDDMDKACVHPRLLLPHIPAVTVNDEIANYIRCGRSVNLPELSRAPQVKVFRGQSDLIAIATRIAGTLFHPRLVLMQESPAKVAVSV